MRERERERERKEALMALKIEREGCRHCRVLEGERLERERYKLLMLRVDRSFLLVLVVCVAHDLAHVSLF